MTGDQADLTVEERIRLLEAHVSVQEELIVAMQAERIEAERLNESVTRLGTGASELGAALLQVDKTQQLLTQLGRDIHRVEKEAASSHEVDNKVAEAKAEAEAKVTAAKEEAEQRVSVAREETEKEAARGRRQRNWIFGGLVVVTLVGAVTTALLHGDQKRQEYEACLESRRTTQGVVIFLTAVSENSRNAEIKRTAQALVDEFDIPVCEEP